MKFKALFLAMMTLSSMAQAELQAEPLDVSENELGYFVSFSIPEKQLVSLIKSAEQRKIPVYIRGLVRNDMNATAKAILYLATKYNIQGVLIDPVRFEHYGITAVPALVKKCGQKFDVMFGNVNLVQALDLMKSQGDCK